MEQQNKLEAEVLQIQRKRETERINLVKQLQEGQCNGRHHLNPALLCPSFDVFIVWSASNKNVMVYLFQFVFPDVLIVCISYVWNIDLSKIHNFYWKYSLWCTEYLMKFETSVSNYG
jgi:hypothetical protein